MSVFVTVAEQKSVGINEKGELVYCPSNFPKEEEIMKLGRATTHNIETIIYGLQRLLIHAKDK